MSDQMYLCGSGLFSSCLADTMSAFVEYKVNVGGCVPESFLPVLKRFDRYLAGCLGKNICFDADTVLGTVHVVRAGDAWYLHGPPADKTEREDFHPLCLFP